MRVEACPLAILIADDERASRDVLCRALSRDGRRVEVAKDGDEAVASLERDVFDVVITDLIMPGFGGLEVFRHAIRANPFSQTVFITGYGSIEMVMGAIHDGAYDFVAKPFKLAEIQLVVRNACDKVLLLKEVMRLRGEGVGAVAIDAEGCGTLPLPSIVTRAMGTPAMVREYVRAAHIAGLDTSG